MDIREIKQKRANLIKQARDLIDLADKEKRANSPEEDTQYNALIAEANTLQADIERREKQAQLEATLSASTTEPIKPDPDGNRSSRMEFQSRGLRELFGNEPDVAEEPEWANLIANIGTPVYRKQFRQTIRAWADQQPTTKRAIQADSDILGGNLVAPLQMLDTLIKAVDDQVYLRQWGTVYPVTGAKSLGAPSLDTDPADPAWTSELLIGSEDSSTRFGRRELTPHPLAKYIKISRKLLQKIPSVESLIIQRLAYKFAIAMEKGGMTGTGVGSPLGVFTASADGVSTSRDVSTGNTTTSMTFDGLKEAKYTLKGQYWTRARWIFHRDGVKQLAKLKDGEGQYIWAESVRVGEPDRLLGLPVFMSEYAPNTFTTLLYVGILGDFSFYWWADSLAMEMQRLVELYAATNQIGLIGRLESDGMPVLAEAFVRVKLG